MQSQVLNIPCFLFSMVALACLNSSAFCQSEQTDVLGKWKLRIDGGGEIYTAYVVVNANDGKLDGHFAKEGRRSRLREIEVDKNKLVVVANSFLFSTPVTATLTCEVTGDDMKGEIELDSGVSARVYQFTGERISKNKLQSSEIETGESNPMKQAANKVVEKQADEQQAVPVKESATNKSIEISFRNGVDGYDKTLDCEIWAIAPTKSLLRQGTMTCDGNNGGGESQVLMRFDKVFGDGKTQIPSGVRIVSATLTVVAFDPGTTCYLHRMLVPWDAAITWERAINGMSIDDLEASKVRDGFTFGEINMDKQLVTFDVTETVQKWSDGDKNFGWVFVNTGSNGWDFYSSDWHETDLRPMLEVTYQLRSIKKVDK